MIKFKKNKSEFDLEFDKMKKDFKKSEKENNQAIHKGFERIEIMQKDFDRQISLFKNKRQ